MSYDISLHHPESGEVAEVDLFEDGGTYAVGGTTEADLNVTYNYAELFGTFRVLDKQRAETTIPRFQEFLAKHGDGACDPDYWKPSPGNVSKAVRRLLSWAEKYPSYVWDVR